jgi:hypothetical protein
VKGKRKANGEGVITGSDGRKKKRKKVMLDEDSINDLYVEGKTWYTNERKIKANSSCRNNNI